MPPLSIGFLEAAVRAALLARMRPVRASPAAAPDTPESVPEPWRRDRLLPALLAAAAVVSARNGGPRFRLVLTEASGAFHRRVVTECRAGQIELMMAIDAVLDHLPEVDGHLDADALMVFAAPGAGAT
jgi:hypothetical protein